jgi:hypothetical protein
MFSPWRDRTHLFPVDKNILCAETVVAAPLKG